MAVGESQQKKRPYLVSVLQIQPEEFFVHKLSGSSRQWKTRPGPSLFFAFFTTVLGQSGDTLRTLALATCSALYGV